VNQRWLDPLLSVLAIVPCALAYAAAIGLGLHRHGTPWAVSLAATMVVFLPPLMVSLVAQRRFRGFIGAALAWSLAGLLILPVYFPGERREAVSAGLALLMGTAGWSDLAERVADTLPDEPDLAAPELAQAIEVPERDLPPARDVEDHEMVLPYEGAGRNLAIPVVFQHGDVELEVMMMLDTGATYTTLPDDILEQLGIRLSDQDPVLRLHTANGERDAHIASMDTVWLGDLALEGVAIASCNPCRSHDTVGLLGLNVAGGFNMAIDADRREVTFSRREVHDRKLDAKPWIDLDARFARYPGGRVEVSLELANHNTRDLATVSAQVRCDERRWTVDVGEVLAGESVSMKRKLPRHESCEAYEISLHEVLF
jgi:predicted aspartyl protease